VQAQFAGQAAPVQSTPANLKAAGWLQLLLMQLASGRALVDGAAAAHFRTHASSPQAQANAQL